MEIERENGVLQAIYGTCAEGHSCGRSLYIGVHLHHHTQGGITINDRTIFTRIRTERHTGAGPSCSGPDRDRNVCYGLILGS